MAILALLLSFNTFLKNTPFELLRNVKLFCSPADININYSIKTVFARTHIRELKKTNGMISNVYYPLNVKQYNFSPNKKVLNGGADNVNPDASGSNKTDSREPTPTNNNRCINKFLTSEDPVIHIIDIVKDIKGTMTHLGVPTSIGNVAMQDLKDIEKESAKADPSIAVIQGKLFKIADNIDQFVSEQLGQPSTVIRQWVDSILLQKINYQSEQPTTPKAISTANQPKIDATNLTNVSFELSTSFGNNQLNNNNIEATAIRTSIEVNNIQDIIPDKKAEEAIKPNRNLSQSTLDIFSPTNSPFTGTITGQSRQIDSSKKAYLRARKAFVEGDYTKASQLYEKSLQQAQKKNNNNIISRTYADLAEMDDNNYDTKSALKNYHQAIKYASQDNNLKLLGKLHYNVGSIYDEMNLSSKALEHYHASISFDGETDNLSGQALTLNNIASLHLDNNNSSVALENYRLAYSLAKQSEDKEGQSHILSNIGSVYKNQNDHIQALEYFRRSMNIDKEVGNTEGYAKNLINIGDIYNFTGQADRAKKYFHKAISYGQEINNQLLVQQAQNRMNSPLAI